MKYIVGIDEVGRGALAGPIMVAALAVQSGRRFNRKVKDSKALSPRNREKVAKWINEVGLCYTIARVYPALVDRINIARAADLAAYRAITRLSKNLDLKNGDISIYLDGGLYLKSKDYQDNSGLRARTVIKGDQKYNAVKLASVVAKVNRDRYMTRLSRFYPGYGFHVHKGYGTKMHREAVRKLGPSKVHRLTFVRKIRSISKRNGRRTS